MSPGFISEPIWLALGWAMLHFLWVGSAIAIAASVIGRLILGRAAAGVRYCFALGVLMLLGAAAALCVWLELPRERARAELPAEPSSPSLVSEGEHRPVPGAGAPSGVFGGDPRKKGHDALRKPFESIDHPGGIHDAIEPPRGLRRDDRRGESPLRSLKAA